MQNKYVRKGKEDKPVLAICYDFDKTLSPDDMQAQGYIQSLGYEDKNTFWGECNEMSDIYDMDQNLTYMYKMVNDAEGVMVVTKKTLAEYGAKVQLFDGVKEWFDRINEYGKAHNVIVEHYIISSGLKDMIVGNEIAKHFEKIYASSFYFNQKGVPIWPAQVINFTNKTQFLARIEKGVLDINDQGVNDYFPPEKLRVPYRNMVYIGDSATDVPCMTMVNTNGGYSIGVYNPKTNEKEKVYKMMNENRIKYFAPADYRDGSELDKLLKTIIDRTEYNEKLENFHFKNEKECVEYERTNGFSALNRIDLISKLDQSQSYASTLQLIEEMKKIKDWTRDDKDKILQIANYNAQVKGVAEELPVKDFLTKLRNK